MEPLLENKGLIYKCNHLYFAAKRLFWLSTESCLVHASALKDFVSHQNWIPSYTNDILIIITLSKDTHTSYTSTIFGVPMLHVSTRSNPNTCKMEDLPINNYLQHWCKLLPDFKGILNR